MTADRRVEAEVRGVLEQFARAYAQRNIEGVLTLFAEDPDLVVYGTGADEKRVGLQQLRSQIHRDWAQTESASLEYSWMSISASGSVAWVAGDSAFKVQIKGHEMILPARLTCVLERRGERFKIVQLHISSPAAGQAEGKSFPI